MHTSLRRDRDMFAHTSEANISAYGYRIYSIQNQCHKKHRIITDHAGRGISKWSFPPAEAEWRRFLIAVNPDAAEDSKWISGSAERRNQCRATYFACRTSQDP